MISGNYHRFVEYISSAAQLESWYESRRSAEWPKFKRIIGIYAKVIRELPGRIRIAPDQASHLFWQALEYCLENFEPAKGNQQKPADQRFLYYFGHCIASRLRASYVQDRKSARKRANREARFLASLDEPEREPDLPTRHFWDEARELLANAIESLDPVSKVYVKLRYIDGLTITQIAKQVGKSERTVKRKYRESYSEKYIIKLVKLNVRKNIMRTSKHKIYKAIYSLIYENGFTTSEVARLFCMSQEEVKHWHDEMLADLVRGYLEDAAKLAS